MTDMLILLQESQTELLSNALLHRISAPSLSMLLPLGID